MPTDTRQTPLTSCTVPTYYPKHETAADEYTDPLARIDVSDEAGIRLELIRPGIEDVDDKTPSVVVERRAKGWAIFLHADDGDAIGVIRIHDDGRSALERDRFSSVMEIAIAGDDAAFTID